MRWRNLLGKKAATPLKSVSVSSSPEKEIPRYPPFRRGLPAAPVDRVLDTQQELVAQLRQVLGFPDAHFDRLVRPVLLRYAAFVHLLPASEAHHHRGAGGLLRHGLEVAFLAARAAKGTVFSDSARDQQMRLEPRWHFVTLLAGLCHDIGKPASDIAVVDRTGNHRWNPYTESLVCWAERQHIDRYFLRWREGRHKRHEMFALLVLDRILTVDCLTYLTEPGTEIVQALLESLAGAENPANPISKLVLEADRQSVERDLRSLPTAGDAGTGVPVERHLLDAMRRLLQLGQWTVNAPGARVWLFPEGLHVVWRTGAAEIIELLNHDGVSGIPRDPDTLADILIERRLAEPRILPNGQRFRYWLASPALFGSEVRLYLLRLRAPELLFDVPPPPVGAKFVDPQPAASARDSQDSDPLEQSPRSPSPPVQTADSASADASSVTGRPLAEDPQKDMPSEPAVAISWLNARGEAGKLLLRLAGDFRAGRKIWDQDGIVCRNKVVIGFPGSLQDYGSEPKDLLAAFEAADILDPDPVMPQRKVREVPWDGGRFRGLVFTAEASARFLALSGTPPAGGEQADTAQSLPKPHRLARSANRSQPRAKPIPSQADRPSATPEIPPDGMTESAASQQVGDLARDFAALLRSREPPFPVVKQDGRLCTAYPQSVAWYARQARASVAEVTTALTRGPDAVAVIENINGILMIALRRRNDRSRPRGRR